MRSFLNLAIHEAMYDEDRPRLQDALERQFVAQREDELDDLFEEAEMAELEGAA